MNRKERVETTTNSRIYKLLKKRILYTEQGLCFYCGPHSGCNGRYPHYNNNWKRYRKTQYKLK